MFVAQTGTRTTGTCFVKKKLSKHIYTIMSSQFTVTRIVNAVVNCPFNNHYYYFIIGCAASRPPGTERVCGHTKES